MINSSSTETLRSFAFWARCSRQIKKKVRAMGGCLIDFFGHDPTGLHIGTVQRKQKTAKNGKSPFFAKRCHQKFETAPELEERPF